MKLPIVLAILALFTVGACGKKAEEAPPAPTPAEGAKAEPAKVEEAKPEPAKVEEAKPEPAKVDTAAWPEACKKALACIEAWKKAADGSAYLEAATAAWDALAPEIAKDPAGLELGCKTALEGWAAREGVPADCK